MMRKIIDIKKRKNLVYSLIFILVFISVFYIKFPHDRLKNRIVAEVENRSVFSKVKIERLKLLPVFKIRLEGLNLIRSDGKNILIDEVVLKPSLLSLLTGEIVLPLELYLLEGKVFGDLVYSKSSGIKSLDLKLEHINFNKLGKLYSERLSEKVISTGYLYGSVSIKENMNGDFRFDMHDLDVTEVRFGNIKLPDILNLKASLRGEIRKNSTLIEELRFDNEDIALRLTGKIPPLLRLSRGTIDLYFKLEVKGSKYAMLKSFLKKDEEGKHAGKIGGTLVSPTIDITGNSNRFRRKRSGNGVKGFMYDQVKKQAI